MTVVIGTAGHIDHGKTTLLRALTGIDADRLPEEQRRGMTIDVGYAHLTLPDGTELDFVDVPGHDRLVGNMLVGAGEIDAAMLVVAADDGPRAQTMEHLALLDALGIGHGMAVVTKADVAGPDRTAEVVAAVERLLSGTTLAGSPVLAVSSIDGDGVEALRAALVDLRDRVLGSAPDVAAHGSRLAIDRVFSVKGRGAVVTGTLRGRPLARGATLRLVPGDRSVRVREIQVHGTAVDEAQPGRTALNVAGVEAGDLHRGLVLTDDPAVVASDRMLVRLDATLPDRARARVHLGTAAVDASIGRSGRDALDLPDGTTRRDRPARCSARGRAGRPVGAAQVIRRRPDRRGVGDRCRAAARDLAAASDRRSVSVAWPRQWLPVTARPSRTLVSTCTESSNPPAAKPARPGSHPTSPRVSMPRSVSAVAAAGDATATLTDVRETASQATATPRNDRAERGSHGRLEPHRPTRRRWAPGP